MSRQTGAVLLASVASRRCARCAAPAAPGSRLNGGRHGGYPTVARHGRHLGAAAAAPTLPRTDSRSSGLSADNLGRRKSVVLAIDRSRSMAGAPLAEAAWPQRQPSSPRSPRATAVAVVAFGPHAVQLRPVLDRDDRRRRRAADARRRRERRAPRSTTRSSLGREHAARSQAGRPRVIVLLTDGNDVVEQASLARRARGRAQSRCARLPDRDRRPRRLTTAPLRQLASQTGGSYHGGRLERDPRGRLRVDRRASSAAPGAFDYVTAARPGDTARAAACVAGPARATPCTDFAVPGDVEAAQRDGNPLVRCCRHAIYGRRRAAAHRCSSRSSCSRRGFLARLDAPGLLAEATPRPARRGRAQARKRAEPRRARRRAERPLPRDRDEPSAHRRQLAEAAAHARAGRPAAAHGRVRLPDGRLRLFVARARSRRSSGRSSLAILVVARDRRAASRSASSGIEGAGGGCAPSRTSCPTC